MGFLVQPLSAGMLLTVAAAAVAVPAVFRLGWQRCFPGDLPQIQRMLRLAAPSCGVLLLAMSVSLPGSPAWAVAFLWLAIVCGEGTWWVLGLRSPRSRPAARLSANRIVTPQAAVTADHEPSELVRELPPDVSQQLTRCSEDDHELVYGMLRCGFGPGERSQNLHLAFCPPLAARPQIEVQQVEGPSVRIKAAQVESFGARLELRLTRQAESQESVVVSFEARAERGGEPC